MDIVLYRRLVRNLLLLVCLLVSSSIAFAQNEQGQEALDSFQVVLDTLEADGAMSALPDTVVDLDAQLAELKQRFAKYETRFLENINMRLLAQALQALQEQQGHATQLVDSLAGGRLADTVAALRESAEQRASRLAGFKNTLSTYQVSLEQVTGDLKELVADSVFFLDGPERQSIADFHALNRLHLQIRQKEIQTQQKLDSVRLLGDEVARLHQENQSLLAALSASQDEVQVVLGRRSAQKIWSAPTTFDRKNLVGSFRASYTESKDIAEYVKQTEWTGRIFLLLLSISFFYWLYTKGKQIHELTAKPASYRYIGDLLKALIFMLTLLPVVSVFTPSMLVQLTQLLLIVLLALVFRNIMHKKQRRALSYLLIYYLLVILTNTLVGADLISRLCTLSLNLVALYICYRMRVGSSSPQARFNINTYIFAALVLIHLIAMLCNIFGYVTYARYWSIAGAVAILQAIALVGFYHIVVSAFERQFRYVSLRGASSRFDKVRTVRSVRKLLVVISILLGIIVLVINLHSVQQFFNWLFGVLDKTRHMGSITFTFGNLAIGILIITVANWLQKHLAALLGDTSKEEFVQAEERSAVLSLMPIFRLLIIVAGFLMGLSALGIGLDRLTVIISALSVGIGFGLQNIINNFISGIILIFEKPFRMGDFIELADKKGRVQEVGIRSSTLMTQEGSEVIIPNGDLLSGRLVNWTSNKSYSRVSIGIKIPKDSDMAQVERVLHDVSTKLDYIKEDSGIEMRYVSIGADMLGLQLNAWIVNIYNEEVFRSQLLAHLRAAFEASGIKMESV